MPKNTLAPRSRKYGWTPDLPDHRDYLFTPKFTGPLPAKVDLRQGCPIIYDQGELGSCTANAIAAALQFDQIKENLPEIFLPSRLFIYYNERVIEGTVRQDAGAMIRDGIKSVATVGAPHEALWPYTVAKFAKKPPAAAFKDAAKHPAITYSRVTPVLDQMKGCLADGYPFVFGFTVFASFESQQVAQTGHAPLPQPHERALGGHAVLAVGYDDADQTFIVRNSWGTSWGMAGYFTLPYAYLTNAQLADDFWTIRAVR